MNDNEERARNPAKKVLLADDSDSVRKRLSALISDIRGIELVGETDNARDTLEAIYRHEPDILVLDIQMPGGNGIQILHALEESTVKPLVIMLTAFPYPSYQQKCLDAGAKFFFDKATEFEQVVEVLRDLSKDADTDIL